MTQWETASASVAGRRPANEDAVLILPLGDRGLFLAVADGMGGITGGKVASSIVLESAKEFLTARFAAPVHPSQLKKILRELCERADDALRSEQKARPHLTRMGTTLTCVLSFGGKFVVANIGDSRVFRLSSSGFERLTVDHTYIQDMVIRTGLKPDPALLRQFGHVLTRSIQGNNDKPDIFPVKERWFTLEEGDGFLLCSDGLILDKVADREAALEQIARENPALPESAEAMISAVLAAGSSDNISVVLARWRSSEEAAAPPADAGLPLREAHDSDNPAGPSAARAPKVRRMVVLAIVLFVCAAAAVIFGVHACAGPANDGVPTAHAWSDK